MSSSKVSSQRSGGSMPAELPPLNASRGLRRMTASDASQSLTAESLQRLVVSLPANYRDASDPNQFLFVGQTPSHLARGDKADALVSHSRLVREHAQDLRRVWVCGRKRALLEVELQMTQQLLHVLALREKLDSAVSSEKNQTSELESSPALPSYARHPNVVRPTDLNLLVETVRDLGDVFGPVCSCLSSPFLEREKTAAWNSSSMISMRRQVLQGVAACVKTVRQLIWEVLEQAVLQTMSSQTAMTAFVQCMRPAFNCIDLFNRSILAMERNLKDYFLQEKGVACDDLFARIEREDAFSVIAAKHCQTLVKKFANFMVYLLGADTALRRATGGTPSAQVAGDTASALNTSDTSLVEYFSKVVTVLSHVPDLFNRWAPKGNLAGIKTDPKTTENLKDLFMQFNDQLVQEAVAGDSGADKKRPRRRISGINGVRADMSVDQHHVDLTPRPAQHLLETMLAECLQAWCNHGAAYFRLQILKFADENPVHRKSCSLPLGFYAVTLRHKSPLCKELRPASLLWDRVLLWMESHRIVQEVDQVLMANVTSRQSKTSVKGAGERDMACVVRVCLSKVPSDASAIRGIEQSQMSVFFNSTQNRTVVIIDDDSNDRQGIPYFPNSTADSFKELSTEDMVFSEFTSQQYSVILPALKLGLVFAKGEYLVSYLPATFMEVRRLQEDYVFVCGLVVRHIVGNIRTHLMKTFYSSQLLELPSPPPAPLSTTLVHVELPWLIRELEALIVSLQPRADHNTIRPSQQDVLVEQLNCCQKLVCDAQREFDENLQRNLRASCAAYFPESDEVWKKTVRGVQSWTPSAYVQATITSVLEPTSTASASYPEELQFRSMESLLNSWLQAFELHVASLGVKFSSFGARQLEADIDGICDWLASEQSHLKEGIAARLQNCRGIRRWRRFIELLLWQPGTAYSLDGPPARVASDPRGRSRSILAHHARIAPEPDGVLVINNPAMPKAKARNAFPTDQEDDTRWLALRLRTKPPRGCGLLCS